MRLIDYLLNADMNSLESKKEIILWTGEEGVKEFELKKQKKQKQWTTKK